MIPTASKRAERMKSAHQIDDDQRQKGEMRRSAGAAHRAHETGIDAFDHQRAVDQREHQQGERGIAGDEQQGLIVEREHVAEQHVQEIDVGALERHDGHPDRKREEVERRQRRILLELGVAGNEPGKQGNDHARDEPARGHGEQIESGEQKSDGRARENRVRHGVAHEAHAPQHQEHADRPRAERQCKDAGERAPHELELGERGEEEVVDHGELRNV